MLILTGSRALALRAPTLLDRQPKDFDFVGHEEDCRDFIAKRMPSATVEDLAPGKIVAKDGTSIAEFEFITPGSSNELMASLVTPTDRSAFGTVPSLDLLFTIKSSHKHKKNSPFFWKTLKDYHRMRSVGAKVRPEYEEFLKLREKETYTYKHPSLMQSKQDFFKDDGIQYTYDHDSIHAAVALDGLPAYTRFQKDGAEVQCDMKKFFACPHDVKINSVLEETAVLAIERSLVPFPGQWTPKQAWHFAFSKVLTSITSGKWRAWAYDNAVECLKKYPEGFWDAFQRGLENGVVKKNA